MAQYIQKKFQQTLLHIGKVEDSLQSGSPVNAPSIRALLEALYHPNLLINGDFQINQRGQSEYAINKAFTNMYTLDCWLLHATGENTNTRIIKLDEGIEIYGNGVNVGLVQYLDIPFKVGMTYSIAMLIDNKLIKDTITLTEKDKPYSILFDGDFNSTLNLTYVSSNNKLQISTYLKNREHHYIIKYIDLFDSDIDYPHVKEDHTIALNRCMSYLQIYDPVNLGLFKAWGENRNSMLIGYIGMYKKMINKPTIMLSFNKIYSDSNVSGYDYEKGTFNVITSISNNSIKIMIKKLNSLDIFNRDYEYFTNTEKITLSCEPL